MKSAVMIALAGWAFAVSAQTVEQRAQKIVLPDRVIRDQPVTEILEAIAVDSVNADPEGVGISIIIRDDAAGAMAGRRLTLTFRGATVERALRLVAAAAALRMQFDANAVVVTPSKNVVGPTRAAPPPTAGAESGGDGGRSQ